MGRRLCLGDIHGMYSKLTDVLDKCKFTSSDTLYCVGDLCDRGNENLKTLQFLMSLNNFYPVIGNHDVWLAEYLNDTIKDTSFTFWLFQCGGSNIFVEIRDFSKKEKLKIYNWMKNIPYMLRIDNKIIMHNPTPKFVFESLKIGYKIEDITMSNIRESGLLKDLKQAMFLWNREVLNCSKYINEEGEYKNIFKDEFNKNSNIIFSGHTPLVKPLYDEDMNICLIDTAAFVTKKMYGKEGYLTVIDIDTFEYWQNGNKKKQNLLDDMKHRK